MVGVFLTGLFRGLWARPRQLMLAARARPDQGPGRAATGGGPEGIPPRTPTTPASRIPSAPSVDMINPTPIVGINRMRSSAAAASAPDRPTSESP